MFFRIIALFLLFGILFFPLRAGWHFFKKENAITQAAKDAFQDLKEGTTQLTYESSGLTNEVSDPIEAAAMAAYTDLIASEQLGSESLEPSVKSSKETEEKPAGTSKTETTENSNPSQPSPEAPAATDSTQANTPPEIAAEEPKPAETTAANYPDQNYYIELAAQEAANEVQALAAQEASQQENAIQLAAVAAYRTLIAEFPEAFMVVNSEASAKQSGNNYGEAKARPKEYEARYTITEGGSTPVAYTIASIPSPIRGLTYELNTVGCSLSGNIVVRWKVKNETGHEVPLTAEKRKALSPRKVRVLDFYNQRMFSIRFDREIPVANCLLSHSITPFGRLECSAEVGPIYENNPSLGSNRVLVYLPGSKEGIPVFINI